MGVNNRQRIILLGMLADLRYLLETSAADSSGTSRKQRGRHRLRAAQARRGLVPINLTGWLGYEPTNSERVMFHREYVRLEDFGLIERCNLYGRRRASHFRFTPQGRQVAEGLDAESFGADGDEIGDPIDLDNVEFMPIDLALLTGETSDEGDGA